MKGTIIHNYFSGESESGDDEVDSNLKHSKTMPESVISLDASDEFLKERVINLPQKDIEGTHNTEPGNFGAMQEIGKQVRHCQVYPIDFNGERDTFGLTNRNWK